MTIIYRIIFEKIYIDQETTGFKRFRNSIQVVLNEHKELLLQLLELERIKTQKEKWNNKTLTEKLWAFYGKKMQTWESGVYQLYYALSLVFDIGPGENDGEIEKDEL